MLVCTQFLNFFIPVDLTKIDSTIGRAMTRAMNYQESDIREHMNNQFSNMKVGRPHNHFEAPYEVSHAGRTPMPVRVQNLVGPDAF